MHNAWRSPSLPHTRAITNKQKDSKERKQMKGELLGVSVQGAEAGEPRLEHLVQGHGHQLHFKARCLRRAAL